MLAVLLLAATLHSGALPFPGVGRGPVQPVGPGPRLSPGRVAAQARAEPRTALEAERAFAADAQAIGQWAAFRKWAAPDAVMFVPQPINAQAWLKGRADPARAIAWWPTAAWVSCDGSLAVDTGGWRRPNGKVGYFTTVWQRQRHGHWRWLMDSGDTLKTARPRPATVAVTRASCSPVRSRDKSPTPSAMHGHGAGLSADGTLLWEWGLNATGRTRVVGTTIWNGTQYVDVFEDLIAVE